MFGQVTQRFLAGTAVAASLVTGSVIVAPVAQAGEMTLEQFYAKRDYPFPGKNGPTSPAGFKKGWCVDAATWAWENRTGTRFHHVLVADFKKVAIRRGFKVGTAPRTGALAVWVAGGTHMAYVQSYKTGASKFKVYEARWKTVGLSYRDINKSDVNNRSNRRGPDYFIYKK